MITGSPPAGPGIGVGKIATSPPFGSKFPDQLNGADQLPVPASRSQVRFTAAAYSAGATTAAIARTSAWRCRRRCRPRDDALRLPTMIATPVRPDVTAAQTSLVPKIQ